MTYRMKIGRKTHTVLSLAAASKLYCELRDKSGKGASQWPDAEVIGYDDKPAARISYNGRVWEPGPWFPNMKPLMEAQG